MEHDVATAVGDMTFQDLSQPIMDILDTASGGRAGWLRNLIDYGETAASGDNMEIPVSRGQVNLSWNGYAIGFEYETCNDENEIVATLNGRHLMLFGVRMPHSAISLASGRNLRDVLEITGPLAMLSEREIISLRQVPAGLDIDLDIRLMSRWPMENA